MTVPLWLVNCPMPPRIGPRREFRLYLADWRESRNLTQKQLADRIGCSAVTISRWETGERRPDYNAQSAFAEGLGDDVDVTDLRRHPNRPSADSLLRDQPPEVVEQAIKLIKAIRR